MEGKKSRRVAGSQRRDEADLGNQTRIQIERSGYCTTLTGGWLDGIRSCIGRIKTDTLRARSRSDRTRWSKKYIATAGCCYSRWTELKTNQQKIDELIRGFFNLVLGDGLDPKAVHREFSKIEGYLDYEGNIGLGRGSYVFFQDGKLAPYNP
jgi:hypothetical protein